MRTQIFVIFSILLVSLSLAAVLDAGPVDADKDGIIDSRDACPATVAGQKAGVDGCSCAQRTNCGVLGCSQATGECIVAASPSTNPKPNSAPSVTINNGASVIYCVVGLPCAFNVAASDSDGTINSLTFNQGFGAQVTKTVTPAGSVSQVYYSLFPGAGTYAMNVGAIDNAGGVTADVITVQVVATASPVAVSYSCATHSPSVAFHAEEEGIDFGLVGTGMFFGVVLAAVVLTVLRRFKPAKKRK